MQLKDIPKILIIDFGSQYTPVIAKEIRRFSVYAEIHSYQSPYEIFDQENVKGIILSGGPKSVYDTQALNLSFPVEKLLMLKKPILAICYGMQFLAYHLNGKVQRSEVGEYGSTQIQVVQESKLFQNIPSIFDVWMSHADIITELPENFKKIAISDNKICVAAESQSIYLLQFHPEIYNTEHSKTILSNFLFNIVCISKQFNMNYLLPKIMQDLSDQIPPSVLVISALSGGVDSMVTTILLHRVIKQRLICIFIDHGFLRKNEAENFQIVFKKQFNIPLKVINAKEIFFNGIKDIIEPEEKRKMIGKLFIQIFENESVKIDNIQYLAQGTLYSDVIESQNQIFVDKIKSHHNVGGLPEKMKLKLIEPLKSLFKDEVRELGKLLSIPNSLLYQYPFPGPGLAIRVLGKITQKKLDVLRKADAIFIHELKKNNLYEKIWQAFTVLPSDLSVGIKGDRRVYGYTIVLRAVSSIDAMTAEVVDLPVSFLKAVSQKITNHIYEVNRVVYDITSKPPGTIEWE